MEIDQNLKVGDGYANNRTASKTQVFIYSVSRWIAARFVAPLVLIVLEVCSPVNLEAQIAGTNAVRLSGTINWTYIYQGAKPPNSCGEYRTASRLMSGHAEISLRHATVTNAVYDPGSNTFFDADTWVDDGTSTITAHDSEQSSIRQGCSGNPLNDLICDRSINASLNNVLWAQYRDDLIAQGQPFGPGRFELLPYWGSYPWDPFATRTTLSIYPFYVVHGSGDLTITAVGHGPQPDDCIVSPTGFATVLPPAGADPINGPAFPGTVLDPWEPAPTIDFRTRPQYQNFSLNDVGFLQSAHLEVTGIIRPTTNQLRIFWLQTPTNVNGTHSFLSTDTITLRATVANRLPNSPVKWTVVGQRGAAGISGFPNNQVHNTDSQGFSTFTFRPSDNPTFVNNRQTSWTNGSRQPNPPLAFEVIAKLDVNGQHFQHQLSQTSLGQLLQDETDTLRQEYVDFQIPVPARMNVVPSLGAGFNLGNYGVQVSVDLPGHFASVLAAYRGLPVTVGSANTSIPASAALVISSGFRNPRRNIAAGSIYPNSRHTQGRALDMQPVPVAVPINGVLTMLSEHGHLYPALNTAANTQSTAFPEKDATRVPLGDPRENHIHLQW